MLRRRGFAVDVARNGADAIESMKRCRYAVALIDLMMPVKSGWDVLEHCRHAMPYFGSHARNLDDINDVFDPLITTGEVIALPLSLMVAGYARHDKYQVSTAILAGEAYVDSAVVDLAFKAVTRRKRPNDVAPGGSYHDTFFAGGQSPFKGSSFPSGHAAGVFSVATVVASRYQHHKWVPWVTYGFATAICFSRVTTRAHFPSDVFLGAALGYTITRYEVLRPRSDNGQP